MDWTMTMAVLCIRIYTKTLRGRDMKARGRDIYLSSTTDLCFATMLVTSDICAVTVPKVDRPLEVDRGPNPCSISVNL